MDAHNLLFLLVILSAPMAAQIVLPEGTRVRVRLDQSLSSATAAEGQSVNPSVTEDVRVVDSVVIAQGAYLRRDGGQGGPQAPGSWQALRRWCSAPPPRYSL